MFTGFHATIEFYLACLCRIARQARTSIVGTLLAAVRLSCPCTWRGAPNEGNHQERYDQYTHAYLPLFALSDHLCDACSQTKLCVQTVCVRPTDRSHKSIDVARGLGAEIHVIRMFVHVERQDRRAARQGVTMICCPLVD